MKKILVTGTHRSGTTWMGKMLSVNPEVAYVHEPFNINFAEKDFSLPLKYWFGFIPDIEDKECFDRSFQRVLSLRAYPNYPDCYAWHFATRCRIRDRFKAFSQRLRTNTVLIKDPIALLSAGHLAKMYDMKVVCMIRHPLAFCSSLKKWNWIFSFNHLLSQPNLIETHFPSHKAQIEKFAREEGEVIDQAILLWNLFHGVIRRYTEAHPDWIFLKHEDVVKDPLPLFRETYRRLGLAFSGFAEREILSSLKSREGETRDAAYKARNKERVLNTWKSRLDPEEVEKINRETAVLRKCFYPEG